MIFTKLSSEQVDSVRVLLLLLTKLEIISAVAVNAKRVHITEMGKPIRFDLIFVKYNADMKTLTSMYPL